MVSGDELPSEVIAFLRDRVPGPSDLEMLLLCRRDATRGWTVPCMARTLGLPESWVTDSLEALYLVALVVCEGAAAQRQFYYRPATATLEATMTTLARIYDERPADVVRVLNDNSVTRVRLAALQAFPISLLLREDEQRSHAHRSPERRR